MKIGAVTLCYNDEATIGATIKCLKPFVDKHVVLISERPYFGEPSPPDRSEEICEDLGVEIIKGMWPLDHFQRTLGNKICSDCDWVLGFDSDELITAEDFGRLKEFLKTTDARAVSICPEVYWKTTDYILRPKSTYDPIMAMRPDVEFVYIRNINCPYVQWGGNVHHLSWCAPKDIYKKVTNYAHATDFDGAKWYEEFYTKWVPGEDVVMPDGSRFGTKYSPLPEELKKYLG